MTFSSKNKLSENDSDEIKKLKISVVIPTHNRHREILNSVESVFKQTVLPSELIVVDDGSTPAVSEKIFENAPSKIVVKLLRNETPKGANNARNKGIIEAIGNRIAFLDDDDQFLPNKIEEILKVIEVYGDNIDLIYHRATINMVNEGVSYLTKPKNFNVNDNIYKALLIKNQIGGTPMVIAKRSKLIEVGLFDEDLGSLQDYELWIRFAKTNSSFHYINKALTKCNYITKKNSISKSLINNYESINIIENKFKSGYKTLTDLERREHEQWKLKMRINKSLMNKQYKMAVKEQMMMFQRFPSVKSFLEFLIILAGPTVSIKIKSIISS